jgi:hypothetical protein
MEKGIRLAHSSATNAREAAQELHLSVAQPDMELVIFFCSSDYDRDVLAAEMRLLFAGVQVVGCTTAGEIGPGGYRENSLVGVSFSRGACTAVAGHFDRLQQSAVSAYEALGQHLIQELQDKAPQANAHNSFAFLLIDGLSLREESVARAFQNAIGTLPLVGGSAGDGLNFNRTYVYVDGSFRANCAALILITTSLPFKVFKTQHFLPTDQRLVITEADPARRIVKEINGRPAAQEYARLVGVERRDLNPKSFAASPVVVLIDGNNYVRSIQKVNPDDSVTFFCAIEEGLVLRVASGVDLVENLEQTFAEIRAEIGPPLLVLGCDCVLRRMEVVLDCLEDRVGKIFMRNHTVGFNTYGEQFRGIHVNQTLTGVAIGMTSSEAHHA